MTTNIIHSRCEFSHKDFGLISCRGWELEVIMDLFLPASIADLRDMIIDRWQLQAKDLEGMYLVECLIFLAYQLNQSGMSPLNFRDGGGVIATQ